MDDQQLQPTSADAHFRAEQDNVLDLGFMSQQNR